jgi:membrane associated rhomboid family serine protease
MLTPQQNPLTMLNEQLKKIKPATRAHLLLALLCTFIHVTEFPAPAPLLLGLHPSKLLQLWRPFTSSAYFGPPSMSMANNIYFLIRYGQNLENEFGTGLQAWFLFVQVSCLTLDMGLSLLMNQ